MLEEADREELSVDLTASINELLEKRLRIKSFSLEGLICVTVQDSDVLVLHLNPRACETRGASCPVSSKRNKFHQVNTASKTLYSCHHEDNYWQGTMGLMDSAEASDVINALCALLEKRLNRNFLLIEGLICVTVQDKDVFLLDLHWRTDEAESSNTNQGVKRKISSQGTDDKRLCSEEICVVSKKDEEVVAGDPYTAIHDGSAIAQPIIVLPEISHLSCTLDDLMDSAANTGDELTGKSLDMVHVKGPAETEDEFPLEFAVNTISHSQYATESPVAPIIIEPIDLNNKGLAGLAAKSAIAREQGIKTPPSDFQIPRTASSAPNKDPLPADYEKTPLNQRGQHILKSLKPDGDDDQWLSDDSGSIASSSSSDSECASGADTSDSDGVQGQADGDQASSSPAASDDSPLTNQLSASSVRARGRGRGLGRRQVAATAPGSSVQWGAMDVDVDVSYPTYEGCHGPSNPLGIDSTPIDFWNQLFPEHIVEMLVDQTNLYAEQHKERSWDAETTCKEMRAFLGVLYLMGIHRLPQIYNYFSKDFVLGVPAVNAVFTTKRFWQLWGNMHLADNSQAPSRDSPDYDKFYKLRQFLNAVRETFKDHFYIGQNVSVGEHTVNGKGCNPCKQDMPQKPVKRGTKIWEIGCSCCAYVYDFQIYTGATEDSSEHGLSYRVMMDLCRPNLMAGGHVVYMNNFFTSVQLLQDLEKLDIYSVGTVKMNRKNLPKCLQVPNLMKKVDQGSLHTCSAGNMTCSLWQDTKTVAFLGNAHPSRAGTTVQRKKKSGKVVRIEAPPLVPYYNANMGAIDRHGQMMSYYSIDRKSRRWWVRIMLAMLDSVMTNAYILYCQCYDLVNNPQTQKPAKPLTHLEFRCAVIHSLIDNFTVRCLSGPHVSYDPALPYSNRGHEPVDMVALELKKKGRCEFCSVGSMRKLTERGKSALRKETHFGCKTCNKRLCLIPCHAEYHKTILADN